MPPRCEDIETVPAAGCPDTAVLTRSITAATYQRLQMQHNERFCPCRWNFTPSPGWTKEEAAVLKLCLMKYGVGRWVQILDTGLLPGKLIQQLNGQTQRLLGQQSLAGVRALGAQQRLFTHAARALCCY